MTVNQLHELIDYHDIIKMLGRYDSTQYNSAFSNAKYLALKDNNVTRYLSLTIADALNKLEEREQC